MEESRNPQHSWKIRKQCRFRYTIHTARWRIVSRWWPRATMLFLSLSLGKLMDRCEFREDANDKRIVSSQRTTHNSAFGVNVTVSAAVDAIQTTAPPCDYGYPSSGLIGSTGACYLPTTLYQSVPSDFQQCAAWTCPYQEPSRASPWSYN